MRNDLIIIEFVNDGDREVLLDPSIIPNIAVSLTGALYALETLPDFRLYLAAADRGSLRIAFRALVGHSISDEERKQLGDSKTAAEVIAIAAAGLVWCGVHLGIFTPDGPVEVKPATEVAAIASTAARNVEVVKALDGFVKGLRVSGADHIIIRVPDAPSCLVAERGSVSVESLGSLADIIPIDFPRGVRGNLSVNIEDKFEVSLADNYPSGNRHAYSGIFYMESAASSEGMIPLKSEPMRVILIWYSVRPVADGSNGTVQVTGTLHSIRGFNMTPMQDVPIWARQAQAILTVQTMTVEE